MNQNFFKTIDTEEKAYLLGFLYADGNISNTAKNKRIKINISTKDIDLLYYFQEILERPKEKGIYYYKNEAMVELSIYSKIMVEDLILKRCIPNKTLFLDFPTEDIVHKKFIPNFILGYFDGDGSLSLGAGNKNPRMDITGTENFLLNMIPYLPKTSNGYKISNEHRTDKVKKIYLCGFKNNFIFFNWLYSNHHHYCLQRKKDNFLFIEKYCSNNK